MTYCSTYIGDLESPGFDPDKAAIGNIPRALAPSLPPTGEHYNGRFHAWVKLRGIAVKETDYTAYVAKVTKTQIEDYLQFAYGDAQEGYFASERSEQLQQIRAIVTALAPDKLYALVAECD